MVSDSLKQESVFRSIENQDREQEEEEEEEKAKKRVLKDFQLDRRKNRQDKTDREMMLQISNCIYKILLVCG